MIDRTYIHAHQHAADAKRGQQKQALGRSRGGFTRKLHVAVDALGNPVERKLAGGQATGISIAPELVADRNDCNIIPGKDNSLVDLVTSNNCTAVIPPYSNRKTSREYDRCIYKERRLVENFFRKLKEFRKIATRYDKPAGVFISFVYFAAVLIWLR